MDRFEEEVAARVGARSGVATVNGTSALHIALKVVGVQPGDEVVTSTLTFIAPVNAIRYVGGYPVLIDAEPKSWQIDPELVVRFLTQDCHWSNGELHNRATGRRVGAVLPVHIIGHPVDMDPILDVCRDYNLPVVEDAAESLGAMYKGRPVGHLGDIGCFSFNGNKIITAGGGGVVVSDNETWADRARYLTTQGKDHPVEYIHNEIGYNYRLTNLQAAIGCAQLELLDRFLVEKRDIYLRYRKALQDIPGICFMREAEWATSAFWMSTMVVDKKSFGKSSRELLQGLRSQKIETRPLWQPNHLSLAHREAVRGPCPVAEHLYETALSLPSSTALTAIQQDRVVEAIVGEAAA